MPGESTLGEILRRQASSRGNHPLLVCDTDRIGYAEADSRSAELARGLIDLGAGKGTHVGLLYPNGSDFVVATLAATRIGAVVIPFSTFVTAPELREQLVDSDVEILLAARSFRSHDYVRRLSEILPEASAGDGAHAESGERLWCAAVPNLRHVVFSLDGLRRSAPAVSPARLGAIQADVDDGDVLAVIYTSGSTSTPKGVVHTHAALLEHQRNLNKLRGLTPADKLFCNSPFFWIGGFAFGLLATLVAGSTLVCSAAPADSDGAAATLDLIEAEKPTMTNGFVAGIAHLTEHPSYATRDFSSLRRGNLYPIMAPECRPGDPELRHNMFGMTEAGGVLLIDPDESDQPETRRGSFGRPAPGFETMLIDPDTGKRMGIGAVGELCIRGPYLMQAYHRRAREECFDADGWFHTADLVRVDADGFVYFVGRRNAMIKTAGANVSAPEVEQAISRITGEPAYVVGLPDPRRGQLVAVVVVVVVRDEAATLDMAALCERLESELSAYKIPRRFVTVSRADVPLRSSGKVDTRRLRELFDA
ncbi:AMP-binding protein [Mycobacterium sherrisii]|uniref:AMP-binding protein n=1 Tax=Mycobacterium sherrisii TaxID=243061 RepID=A0A1E3T6S2_9MYCO|nr:class I adenylate-forming enzyme family protein [Mycobacterium sherrisii]ODR10031.1 AMP-binding protein [Mycobacterium sherrisii]